VSRVSRRYAPGPALIFFYFSFRSIGSNSTTRPRAPTSTRARPRCSRPTPAAAAAATTAKLPLPATPRPQVLQELEELEELEEPRPLARPVLCPLYSVRNPMGHYYFKASLSPLARPLFSSTWRATCSRPRRPGTFLGSAVSRLIFFSTLLRFSDFPSLDQLILLHISISTFFPAWIYE
jgi:hypothetical protein